MWLNNQVEIQQKWCIQSKQLSADSVGYVRAKPVMHVG